MQVSFLLYQGREDFADRADPDKQVAFWRDRIAYHDALVAAGILAGSARLQAPETAVTLRLRNGRRIVEDGPYADTREQLAGLLILDVPDIADAVDWMWRCPAVKTGTVELRPNLTPPRSTATPVQAAGAILEKAE